MQEQTVYLKKLSLLLDFIDFAKVDGIVECEYDFLQNIAEGLGMATVIFRSLFNVEIERVKPRTQVECIQHFYKLVKLMNVDHKQSIFELNTLHEIGVSMGLSPQAIQEVLSVMHNYPNEEVPFSVVENAFKAQCN